MEPAIALPITFFGFAKAGLFTTSVHLKNHTSIIRKNCQPKHCTPAFAKPMLADALLSWCELSCRLCDRCIFIFSKRGEEKNEVLVGRERTSSFASFGLSVGFVRLANVLVCVLAILQSLPKSLQ